MTNDQLPQDTLLGRYAGFVTRLIAWIIDRLIVAGTVSLIIIVAQFVTNELNINQLIATEQLAQLIATIFILVVAIAVPLLYDFGFWLLAGQTPGKWVMGVRIVRTDGERLRAGNCVRRIIGYWISAILFLGYLWVLVDNRRQGFHDKLAGTLVVYSWPEQQRVTPVRDRVHRFRRSRQMAQDAEKR
jgi:uncharacterized RDD family membrane protein YckC